ncbi:MAG: type transport system permease protein [Actinomycetota bacterium]|nr:type transport system permease protein [Actinomycetota bacterium]
MAVVAYEQRRIRTIRSTWIILVVTLALAAAIAALTAGLANIDPVSGQRGAPVPMRDVLAAVSNPIVLIPVSVLAAMAFGGEYRFGLIRQTLTAFPRRTRVFLAKMWVASLWMLAILVLAALVIVAVAFGFRSNLIFEPLTVENLGIVGRSLLFGIGYCLYAFALVVITRNQALSIVILIVWTLLVESLLTGFLAGRWEWLPQALPMSAGSRFVAGEDLLLSAAVFFGLLVALLLIAWAVFTRRDA